VAAAGVAAAVFPSEQCFAQRLTLV
jgi:hypothetical protein